MKSFRFSFRVVAMLAIAAIGFGAQAAGVDIPALVANYPNIALGLAGMGMLGELDAGLLKALDSVETKLKAMSDKADGEMKTLGKVAEDTKTAIDTIGVEQRELADRMLKLEQSKTAPAEPKQEDGYGEQFVKSAEFESFKKADARGRTRIEVKNTVTNAIGSTYSERRPGIVEGAFRLFTIEDLLTKIPTSAPSIDWVRENVFTNAAAETAEGVAKPQSSLTFTTGTMPVSTVAHWIKITRQLAMDNAALAAYINRRMVYGVNLRVENQLLVGNGTAPNINGLLNTGNFTAHGYTAANLTSAGLLNNRFDLIGATMGDSALADYPADTVILNTGDWWKMRLAKDSQGRYLLGEPGSAAVPQLFGANVVASNAMTAGSVWIGNIAQAATLWIREGVVVEMSDSDENNFQLNLITIRAERRLALTVEKPAAARFGLLVPA
ncbi:phage major capsid protein [Variovorax saccharolyticus]|uniref:phage major capsid protein n=1 Tax=Variovorax saccharolyticus TaxID=3053516 RepID=UPI002576A26A|nr:phage major capsid protein [Variovorax sp. J31P216]MDM0024085.1 phage major capsid protein [Variovorax sp. J31P216]